MAELGELRSRAATLVVGYLNGVDRQPKGLAIAAPHRRLAVVLSTYAPEFPGGYFFDHDLVLKLCAAIVRSRKTQVKGWPRHVRTLDELAAAWQTGWDTDDYDDPSNNDLFEELLVLEKGKTGDTILFP